VRRIAPAIVLASASLRPAQAAADPIPLTRFTLQNGLRVLLAPLPARAQVAVRIEYEAGGTDDPPGYPETSHLVEHLLFRGTRHTDGPLWRHLAHFGATGYNATTGALITSYFEQGDASQVDRLLWLESERLAFGLDAITPANVALERDLVWSEHELRADRTEAAREGALLDALFPPGHPWRTSARGVVSRGRLTVDAARWFFQRWYMPGNARLVVVGGFDPAAVRAAVERWFGAIPARTPPPRRVPPVAPPTAPVEVQVGSPTARGALLAGWITPALGEPGHAELDEFAVGLRLSLRSALTDPATGEELTREVTVMHPPRPTVSYLAVVAELSPGVSVARARSALDLQLARALARCDADARVAVPPARAPLALSVRSDLLDVAAAIAGMEREGLAEPPAPGSACAAARRWLDPRHRVLVVQTPGPGAPRGEP